MGGTTRSVVGLTSTSTTTKGATIVGVDVAVGAGAVEACDVLLLVVVLLPTRMLMMLGSSTMLLPPNARQ